MGEVSYYGTRSLHLSPEAILHYASLDWQTGVMSTPRRRDFLLWGGEPQRLTIPAGASWGEVLNTVTPLTNPDEPDPDLLLDYGEVMDDDSESGDEVIASVLTKSTLLLSLHRLRS